MSYQVQQSTTAYPLVFLMVQSSDHITGLTGASPTVTISKNGGSFASPSGAVTEIANGWYQVAGNATDSNTLGPLVLHATAASGDPTDTVYQVVIDDLTKAALRPTTAGRTLDVSAGGEAGVDWANVGSPTTSNNLSGTTIATTQKVDVDTIKTNPVVNGGTITFPTNATLASTTNITAGTITTVTTVTNQLTAAQIATGVWQDATAGDFTAASSIGKSLYTSGNAPGAASGLALVGSDMGVVSSVTGAVGSVTGNVGGNVTGSVGSVVGAVGSVTGAVGSVTGNVGGNVVGSVGSVTGAVGSVTGAVGSVTGNVGGNVVGSVASVTAGVTVTTNNDKTGYSLTQSFPSNFASLSITAAGKVDVGAINGTTVNGSGVLGDEWGP